VTDLVRLPGGGRAVSLSGVARGIAGAAHTDQLGAPARRGGRAPGRHPRRRAHPHAEREYRAVVEEILELRGADDRIAAFLRAIAEPGPLADTIGYAPDVSFEQKLEVLETLDVTERLELAARIQRERLTELQLRKKIRDDVQSGADKQQREYFLRKQMESISTELGEDDGVVHRRVPHEDRRSRHARRGARAGRARARAGSSAGEQAARAR
jgi:ATP-dependent Lon protease